MELTDMATSVAITCQGCSTEISEKTLLDAHRVCPECGYHHPITAYERLELLVDEGSFDEHDAGLYSTNPLDFPNYEEQLARDYAKTGLKSEILTGKAKIGGQPVAITISDFGVRGGTMGAVVGEKVTRNIEYATQNRLPLIIVSRSGGMRMQEGTLSLMQMAKTSSVCVKHAEAGLPYISVMADPTFGGSTASYASLAHIILAEPGARIGFAGPLATASIKQQLPENFQKAEFLLEHGMIDRIVQRSEMRSLLIDLLDFCVDPSQ
jgi:acetyl-CoA carboxylase carboxyl transferase subunit beta